MHSLPLLLFCIVGFSFASNNPTQVIPKFLNAVLPNKDSSWTTNCFYVNATLTELADSAALNLIGQYHNSSKPHCSDLYLILTPFSFYLHQLSSVQYRKDRWFSIMNIIMENNVDFPSNHEERVSKALFYVAKLVSMISYILNLPLQYPVECDASRAWISDPLLSILKSKTHSSKKSSESSINRYPLFWKGESLTRFRCGFLLLTRNVQQILIKYGIRSAKRHMLLPNLYYILTQYHRYASIVNGSVVGTLESLQVFRTYYKDLQKLNSLDVKTIFGGKNDIHKIQQKKQPPIPSRRNTMSMFSNRSTGSLFS